MKVSIIIVSYNNEIWVEQCLDSILNQNYDNIEVIWIDNGSKDKTVGLIKQEKYIKLKIKLKVLEKNVGFASANNEGYIISKGDIIFLLNSDARIEPNTISKVVKTFEENNNVGIIQNKILLINEPTKLDSAGSLFTVTGFLKHIARKESIDFKENYPIFGGKGASLFIKKEVIVKSYLFNPYFTSYFEDTDICWRAWIMGYEVIFSPSGITYHKGGATAFWLSSGITDFHSFKNRIFCLLTCLNILNLIIILPTHIFLCLLISLIYLIRGKFKKAFAIIKAIAWNIGNFDKVIFYRQLINSKRILKDKEIFRKVMSKFSIEYAIRSLLGYTSF